MFTNEKRSDIHQLISKSSNLQCRGSNRY